MSPTAVEHKKLLSAIMVFAKKCICGREDIEDS